MSATNSCRHDPLTRTNVRAHDEELTIMGTVEHGKDDDTGREYTRVSEGMHPEMISIAALVKSGPWAGRL